ncbi:hypothetical protein [Streptomyces massasporeus]|uniref:hypothetical protein n=1 Tax=Streptomyces massasporeus TaxID=67324 RepID=UPI0033DA7D77
MIAVPCYFFYVKEIRPIRKAQEAVSRNKEVIDEIHATAISLMELSFLLQSLAFKHSEQTAEMLRILRPKMRAIPVIRRFADSSLLSRSDSMAQAIVGATRGSQELLEDIDRALRESDIRRLKKYRKKLGDLKRRVNDVLAAEDVSAELEASEQA